MTQYEDHVIRREMVLKGWLGIASRIDMIRPEPVFIVDLKVGEVYERPYYSDLERFNK